MICPACGSTKVHRSRRKWYERPMVLLGVRAYRCHACQHRFYTAKPEKDESRERAQSAKSSD